MHRIAAINTGHKPLGITFVTRWSVFIQLLKAGGVLRLATGYLSVRARPVGEIVNVWPVS